MKKTSIALLALALTGGAATAADLGKKKAPAPAPVVVSPWDFTVGGGLTTNYIFRGISQSNNGAASTPMPNCATPSTTPGPLISARLVPASS